MGDQRRRGRGRSGRGGRIPRKGEGQQASSYSDETFVSFPADTGGPIVVASALDPAVVSRTVGETLGQERTLATALAGLAEATGDASLHSLRTQVERHRDVLQQLARDLDVTVDGPNGEPVGESSVASLVAGQRQTRLGWLTLQRIAYASGDKRVDRAVRPVLAEKERHAQVLESYALAQATLGLFKDPEE